MIAIIVVIVKTMFRFSPQSPSSLNQSRNKGLGPQPQCIATTLLPQDKSWDNVRSSVAPYTESRLTHLAQNKCVGFQVAEQPVSD